jgi:N-methylhydantoinase A
VEIVTVRSTALGDLGRAEPASLDGASNGAYRSETRPVTFGRRTDDAAIVRREDLGRGAIVDGPAVITEQTATTVVPPGARATVDQFGTLVVSVGEEA